MKPLLALLILCLPGCASVTPDPEEMLSDYEWFYRHHYDQRLTEDLNR